MITQKIKFGIDRKEISHFTSIELHQTINKHHNFTIKVPHSVIEEPRAYTMQNAQNWLGKTVHIALENQNNFIGIVTDVKFELKEDIVGNQIIISGHSKTEILESGSKMYSWEEVTLKEIVEGVLKKGVGKYRELKNEINPEYKQTIKYQTQYNETDFQFLQRLAKQYNEWFYYNGEILIFGKPTKFDKEIPLLLGIDLSKFVMGLKTIPHHFSSFTYDENQDVSYMSKTNQEIKPMSRLGKFAIDASAILYNTHSLEHGKISTGHEGALEQLLNAKQQSAIAKSNTISAKSRNPKLKVGSIIEIGFQEKLPTNLAAINNIPQSKINYIDTYIITKITHKANEIGEYFNSFSALPVNITKLPEPKIKFPNAKLQEAVVVDNNDPKGTGRIRVKMEWQQGSMRTPWLRVMTPDAGSSAEVGTNRGMVFIPEIGDHVLLGFRHNDPNRPLVIGSLFHGKNSSGGGAKNKEKSLRSKTGNNITLDDSIGKGAVLINDAIGNSLTFDGSGNTVAQAGDTNVINVGKSAESHFKMDKDGNIALEGKNSFKVTVGKSILELLADGTINLNGKKFKLDATDTMDIASAKNHISGESKLDGGDVFIN
ncbi:hypothetical protein B0A58_00180 [Flavobacterium branchiophilum NBRC 15030 = ATCC 35035]|uniref:Late control gene D protein (GPD) n=1 Tax=Flavobacterium branchiophilum TaxID=55197 RepID=A0A543G6U5_9FLAO|nr:phage baseplate assembly protein V [Flavobacterium branchiophilum]OXA82327.1 hypothetical protein B0A58_00180 [Flavobacterium branchiophilum NBRC 15030 = ATCC 35035]TQM41800.1 late control gene D protein (GPD) [Flavobacterium branchiophilum]GEM56370.1 type IV secretion protein Rhs [Flavobacterium branchiophilum NBRC 15030 = ATCC 35035]